MNNKTKFFMKFIITCFVSVLLASCAASPEKRADSPSRIYNAPFEKVYDATLVAFQNLDIEIFEQDKSVGYIEGGRRPALFQGSEKVGVFLEKSSADKTVVRIDNNKALAGIMFAVDWTDKLFDQIDKQLNMK